MVLVLWVCSQAQQSPNTQIIDGALKYPITTEKLLTSPTYGMSKNIFWGVFWSDNNFDRMSQCQLQKLFILWISQHLLFWALLGGVQLTCRKFQQARGIPIKCNMVTYRSNVISSANIYIFLVESVVQSTQYSKVGVRIIKNTAYHAQNV